MPLYNIQGTRILFIHIPRTGGSYIEDLLGKYLIGLLDRKFENKRSTLPCSPQHWDIELLEEWDVFKSVDKVFTIVRDPLSRLCSEYRYRQPGIPFNTWFTSLAARYEQQPYLLDNHIKPQHLFINSKVKVFSYENLGNLATFLGVRGKITFSVPNIYRLPGMDTRIRDFYKEDYKLLREFKYV